MVLLVRVMAWLHMKGTPDPQSGVCSYFVNSLDLSRIRQHTGATVPELRQMVTVCGGLMLRISGPECSGQLALAGFMKAFEQIPDQIGMGAAIHNALRRAILL